MDALIPLNIKQSLYAFDEYQTYDLIWGQKIDLKILTILYRELGDSFLVIKNESPNFYTDYLSYTLPIALIERYTPYDIVWANNWTDYVYNFLKKITGTTLSQKPYADGSFFGYPDLFSSNFNINNVTIEKPSHELNLTLKNQSIYIISYLSKGHLESGNMLRYPNYNSYFNFYNKKFHIIKKTTIGDEIIRFTLPDDCLLGSVICDDLEVDKQIPSFWRYAKIEETLNDILEQIGELTIKRYISSVTVNVSINENQNQIEYSYQQPLTSIAPEWYHYASLIRANNNYWNNIESIPLNNLGYPVNCFYLESQDKFIFGINLRNPTKQLNGLQFRAYSSQIRAKQYLNPYGLFTNALGSSVALSFVEYEWVSPELDQQTNSLLIVDLMRERLSGNIYYWYNWVYDENGNLKYALSTDLSPNLLERFTFKSFTIFGKYYYQIISSPAMIDENLIGEVQGLYDYQFVKESGVWGIPESLTREITYSLSFLGDNFMIPTDVSYELLPDYSGKTGNFTHIINYTPHQSAIFNSGDDTIQLVSSLNQLHTNFPEETLMPDSIRLKEIHACLQADKYAHDGDNLRIANLGYYIERIARVLGISVNPDGSIRSIRQSKHIPAGEDIPAGWSFGQWGRNQGGSQVGQKGGLPSQDRDGLVYEVRSNLLKKDSNDEIIGIEQGGYVLVENLPQLIHILIDDLDKALGLQYAGGNIFPSADNENIVTNEGLYSLIAEIAWTLSNLSGQLNEIALSSISNRESLKEIIMQFGIPTEVKSIGIRGGSLPYAGFSNDAPSLLNLFGWILQNLSPLLASQIAFMPKKQEDKSEEGEG